MSVSGRVKNYILYGHHLTYMPRVDKKCELLEPREIVKNVGQLVCLVYMDVTCEHLVNYL